MSSEQPQSSGKKKHEPIEANPEDLGPNAKAQSENILKVKKSAETLRTTVVQTHKKIGRRLELMKCWPEVMALIDNGEKVEEIARFIQEDRRESLNVKRKTVVATIYYWLSKNRAKGERAPTKHLVLIGSMSENVDSLSAINMLFAIQVDRITEHYAVEKEHKNFTNFNNNAIRIAKEIVQTMSEIELKRRPSPGAASLEQASGASSVNDTYLALQRMGQTYAEKFGINAANVILNDESRRRVMSALEKVRQCESTELMDILKNNQIKAEQIRKQEDERIKQEAEEFSQKESQEV